MKLRHVPLTVLTALTVLLFSSPPPLSAQTIQPSQIPPVLYPDARLVPRGALRVSFEPHYLTYDHRFGLNGEREALGTDLTSDSAGADLFPTLLAAQRAVQRITGLASYRMTLGRTTTGLDADVRRFPFTFALGLTDRVTLALSLPVVTTRMQVAFTVDSSAANVGWNQAAPAAGSPGAGSQILTLLTDLEAGAAEVQRRIDRGEYGCPTSAQCDQARDLVQRTRTITTELSALTGVSVTGSAADEGRLPPFAPLAASPAGLALVETLANLSAELELFGAQRPRGALVLPTATVGAGAVQTMLGDSAFGYLAHPLRFAKYRNVLGDAELGIRFGLVQRPALRAVMGGSVRLPTGRRDSPDHLVDLGTGERQTDLVARAEAVWAPGSVLALSVAGSYTAQLPDRLERRVTPPDQPVAPAWSTTAVDRDLGDMLEFSAYPSLRLSPGFTAYTSVHYLRKGPDRYDASSQDVVNGDVADVLERNTQVRSLSFGAGVHYHMEGRDGGLPVQAGIHYRAAYRGSGGGTPQDVSVNFYLRLYYRVLKGR